MRTADVIHRVTIPGGIPATVDIVVDLDGAWAELTARVDADPDAVTGDFDDRAERLIAALHRDGDPRTAVRALPMLTDPSVARRRLAARVLGHLGYEDGRPFTDVVAPALAAAARTADDDERAEFVWALSFVVDPRWAGELRRYAADPVADVRLAVARNLVLSDGELDDASVAALVGLSTDPEAEVRDWAVFSLGSLSDADTPVIRDALAARLDDELLDVQLEATAGLARRGDLRALPSLLRRLAGDPADVYRLDLESAADLAGPALVPVLVELRAAWAAETDREFRELVLAALDRCDLTTDDAGAG